MDDAKVTIFLLSANYSITIFLLFIKKDADSSSLHLLKLSYLAGFFYTNEIGITVLADDALPNCFNSEFPVSYVIIFPFGISDGDDI